MNKTKIPLSETLLRVSYGHFDPKVGHTSLAQRHHEAVIHLDVGHVNFNDDDMKVVAFGAKMAALKVIVMVNKKKSKHALSEHQLYEVTAGIIGHMNNQEQVRFIEKFAKARLKELKRQEKVRKAK